MFSNNNINTQYMYTKMYPKKLNITSYQQQTINNTILKGCQIQLQQKVSNT